ncbi:hypothetical protein Golax_015674, partial [Gossypium laxum]|nr:hypothetical protein [Gossypium laxum]
GKIAYSLRTTSFDAHALPGDSQAATVDKSLLAREAAIKLMKYYLHRAANHMKQQADNKMSDRQFEVGNSDYLKLPPYRQKSVTQAEIDIVATAKDILQQEIYQLWTDGRRILAYYTRDIQENGDEESLRLLKKIVDIEIEDYSSHSVFLVSQLMKHVGQRPVQSQLPVINDEGILAK